MTINLKPAQVLSIGVSKTLWMHLKSHSTCWIPTEQLCTTTGYQKETPWISRKLQKVKLFKESYEYKGRSLGFSWSNVYYDASPEGDAIRYIYIYIYYNRRVIFKECLIVFQSICSKSTRKCNSDQIPSVEFYY